MHFASSIFSFPFPLPLPSLPHLLLFDLALQTFAPHLAHLAQPEGSLDFGSGQGRSGGSVRTRGGGRRSGTRAWRCTSARTLPPSLPPADYLSGRWKKGALRHTPFIFCLSSLFCYFGSFFRIFLYFATFDFFFRIFLYIATFDFIHSISKVFFSFFIYSPPFAPRLSSMPFSPPFFPFCLTTVVNLSLPLFLFVLSLALSLSPHPPSLLPPSLPTSL